MNGIAKWLTIFIFAAAISSVILSGLADVSFVKLLPYLVGGACGFAIAALVSRRKNADDDN